MVVLTVRLMTWYEIRIISGLIVFRLTKPTSASYRTIAEDSADSQPDVNVGYWWNHPLAQLPKMRRARDAVALQSRSRAGSVYITGIDGRYSAENENIQATSEYDYGSPSWLGV